MKIGVFDSGLGGLAILRELLRLLPQYDYIYYGDNANVPYGGKTTNEIYKLTEKAVDFLFKKDCALVILACNTATAVALRKLQQKYLVKNYPDRRILGVIRPTVEAVIESGVRSHGSGVKSVGVMGTYATVISKKFVKELRKFDKNIQVFQQACPLLVPIIEKGKIHWEKLDLILKKYLEPLQAKKIDSLILGCTHYGLIDDRIRKITGEKIKIISEGEITALKLRDYLERHKEIEKKLSKNGQKMIYLTQVNKSYKKMINSLLGKGKVEY